MPSHGQAEIAWQTSAEYLGHTQSIKQQLEEVEFRFSAKIAQVCTLYIIHIYRVGTIGDSSYQLLVTALNLGLTG